MSRRSQRGITLIELMIVVVVVAILAAIAYPSYRQQVLRTNRSSAKTQLTQTAQVLERCFTRFSAYNDVANCPVANTLNGGGTLDTPDGLYRVSAVITATTFDLTATPQAAQAGDVCGNLTLDETGTRAASGGTMANCWRR